MSKTRKRIGLIGARGHTGGELIRLFAGHPNMELAFASSRELAGQKLPNHDGDADSNLCFENIALEDLAERQMDACVLALPNGLAKDFVAALDAHHPDCIVLDLSADFRLNKDWYYGLPELTRAAAPGKRRISNPGCYATAMQLAIAPVLHLLDGPPSCFGVSGYSGAGTQRSGRNDAIALASNLLPYQPVGHFHEKEVAHHLQHAVNFVPHVAEFFRGISMTVMLPVKKKTTLKVLAECYRERYAGEALIRLSDEIPSVAGNAREHYATVGGWHVADDTGQAVVFATLDNLLKGAATQAVQNLNLAFGLPETEGIPGA